MTPAGTSNELDVQNGWEENTHTREDVSALSFLPSLLLRPHSNVVRPRPSFQSRSAAADNAVDVIPLPAYQPVAAAAIAESPVEVVSYGVMVGGLAAGEPATGNAKDH